MTVCQAALFAGMLAAAGCSRTENATTGSADRAAPDQTAAQRERDEYANRLERRVSDMERRVADLKASAGEKTKTRARLDDVQDKLKDLRAEVAELRKPSVPTEWWPMTERYVEREAQRVGTGVRGRTTGSADRAETKPAPNAATTDASADLAARRDRFIQRMQQEIASLDRELNQAANRLQDIDVEDVRSKLMELREEVQDLNNVTAANWWEATKARLDRAMNRIERAIENTGKDAKDTQR